MSEPATTDNKIPRLVPDADERDSHHRAVSHRPTAGSGGGGSGAVWTLSLMLLLSLAAGVAGGLWFWEQLQQASARMTQQQASLEQVRQRLSTTHIDLSEHSKGLAGQLQALIINQNELQGEMSGFSDQLRNLDIRQHQLGERQQQIAEQHKQLSQRQQRQDQQWQRNAESLSAGAKALREESQSLMVRVEALREKSTRDSGDLSTALTALQDKLHGVDGQLRQLSESAALFERRLELSEEWIEGINAYRREINERIFRMQQLLINRVGAEVGAPPPVDDNIDLDLQEQEVIPSTVLPALQIGLP